MEENLFMKQHLPTMNLSSTPVFAKTVRAKKSKKAASNKLLPNSSVVSLAFKEEEKELDAVRLLLEKYPRHKVDLTKFFEKSKSSKSSLFDAFPTVSKTLRQRILTNDKHIKDPVLIKRISRGCVYSTTTLNIIKERLNGLISTPKHNSRNLQPITSQLLPESRLIPSATLYLKPPSRTRNNNSLTTRASGSNMLASVSSANSNSRKKKVEAYTSKYYSMLQTIESTYNEMNKEENSLKTIETMVSDLYQANRDSVFKQYVQILRADRKPVLPKDMKSRFRTRTIRKFLSIPQRQPMIQLNNNDYQ